MAKKLMKGAEAIAEAAIQAGGTLYFGYPITPQTEVAEYLVKRLPEVGGTFVQAESEVAVGNMLYGAAATGTRVFTSSSSPGISLMAEAISYIACSELPAVFINIIRSGPGLGGILPAQSDYFQATKAAGHGDFHCLVLAPASVQEAVDLVILAFDLADKYTNPVMVIGDGMIGQMMEPVEFKPYRRPKLPPKTWATNGCKGREANIITSLYLNPDVLDRLNHKIKAKYDAMWREEKRYDTYNLDADYRLLIVSYGTMARICKTAIDELKAEGIEVGLVRPISLYPFPREAVHDAALKAEKVLTVEMSMGQMVEDVDLSLRELAPSLFYGRAGGYVPPPEEIIDKVKEILTD